MIASIVGAIWLAIVTGFGIDLVKRAQTGALTFPLVVHAHVVAYAGWLVLMAAQVCLIRTRRVTLHRRLGMAVLILLPMMLVLGPAAALVQASNPYMPDKWIAWLSVQFTNALGSAVLIGAGFLWRQEPAAHKRLMLMGTIALTEPGFGRIWEAPVSERWGDGTLPMFFATYTGTLVLMLAVGAYDLFTRGRLHGAYVAAAVWIFANELLATWLFHEPFWLAWMKSLTGHHS